MSRFASSLQATAQGLDLPPPEKARVLVELASDMDDYYEHCIARGMSPEVAQREVEERLQPSVEALDELRAVHTTGLAAWLHGPRGSVEFVVAMTALAAVVLLSRPLLYPWQVVRDAGVLVWPAAVLALFAVGTAVWQLGRVALRLAPDVRTLRSGADRLLRSTVALGAYSIALHLVATSPMLAIVIDASAPDALGRATSLAALLSLVLVALAMSTASAFALERLAQSYELATAEQFLVAPDKRAARPASRALPKEKHVSTHA